MTDTLSKEEMVQGESEKIGQGEFGITFVLESKESFNN